MSPGIAGSDLVMPTVFVRSCTHRCVHLILKQLDGGGGGGGVILCGHHNSFNLLTLTFDHDFKVTWDDEVVHKTLTFL